MPSPIDVHRIFCSSPGDFANQLRSRHNSPQYNIFTGDGPPYDLMLPVWSLGTFDIYRTVEALYDWSPSEIILAQGQVYQYVLLFCPDGVTLPARTLLDAPGFSGGMVGTASFYTGGTMADLTATVDDMLEFKSVLVVLLSDAVLVAGTLYTGIEGAGEVVEALQVVAYTSGGYHCLMVDRATCVDTGGVIVGEDDVIFNASSAPTLSSDGISVSVGVGELVGPLRDIAKREVQVSMTDDGPHITLFGRTIGEG